MRTRHKRRQKQDERICQNGDNCTYDGDGGYWCLEMSKLVMDDFEPTDDYFCCGGKMWAEGDE